MAPDLFRQLWWWLGVNGPDAYTSFQWLSLLSSVPLAFFAARRLGLSWKRFGVLCALTYLTALLTSKLLWLLTVTPDGFIRNGIAEQGMGAFLVTVFVPPWRGGQVFYGSVLGVGLAAAVFGPLVYRSAWRQTALTHLDVTVLPLLVISAVGRVGCHFAGCCFGRVVSEGVGIHFPPTSEPVRHFVSTGVLASEWFESPPLAPTQLWEAASSALLVAFLVTRLRKGWAPGTLALVGLSVHAASRFVIEYFRFDPRGAFGPLTTSQWLGVAAVSALALVVWWVSRRQALGPDRVQSA